MNLRNTETVKGGGLLPRVALTNMKSLDDLSGENKDAAALTGPTVYNTTPCTEGVYTWNGSKWNLAVSTIRDCSLVQDAEGHCYYAYRVGATGCWITQNLRSTYTTDSEGNKLNELTENGDPEEDTSLKYYWYLGQNPNVEAGIADDILITHPEYGLLLFCALSIISKLSIDNQLVIGHESRKNEQIHDNVIGMYIEK